MATALDMALDHIQASRINLIRAAAQVVIAASSTRPTLVRRRRW
jgi:hypothetical protein